MKKIGITIAIICGFLLPSFVYAQEVTLTPTPTTSKTAKEKRTEAREALKEAREEMKVKRVEAKEEFSAKVAAAKEEFKAKREEFKEKLALIKDEQKQKLVETIDKKVVGLNTRHTEHLLKTLDRLSAILANLVEKTNAAKGEGLDTKAVEAAITQAETALAAAQTAVDTQAAKDYTPTVTTETTLRTNVGSKVNVFRADIRAVHEKVLAAKAAVKKVHLEYVKIKGLRGTGRNPGDATPSARTTATPTVSTSATPTTAPSVTVTPTTAPSATPTTPVATSTPTQ